MSAVESINRDDVSIISLNRPQALNAIDRAIIAGINSALDEAEQASTIAVVLTGTGRAFCAGADLKEPLVDPTTRVQEMHALALRLQAFPKITVAALNGLAFGGGLELAMACTFRVAARDALLALPEAKLLKVMPGYGGTQLLPRIIGPARALELLLTGEAISAERAEQIGLVNAVVDEGCVEVAADLALRASVAGPSTIASIKWVVYEGMRRELPEALRLEADAVRTASASDEAKAAIAAFANRTKTP